MKKLLIATTNQAKFEEISRYLAGLGAELVSLSKLGVTEKAPETGTTFEENAVMKARFYLSKTGLPTLADDGGFEIDALDGEPGVMSHRWVHQDREATDEELISHTMDKLKRVPEKKRGAQLRVVIVFATPEGQLHTAEDAIRGMVPLQPAEHRTPGFPYRSLLFLPELGKFYDHVQLTPEEMARYNHRKRTLAKLAPALIQYYAGH